MVQEVRFETTLGRTGQYTEVFHYFEGELIYRRQDNVSGAVETLEIDESSAVYHTDGGIYGLEDVYEEVDVEEKFLESVVLNDMGVLSQDSLEMDMLSPQLEEALGDAGFDQPEPGVVKRYVSTLVREIATAQRESSLDGPRYIY